MKTIHHIAIAVSDLDAAENIYRDFLGLKWERREEVPGHKVMTSIFRAGESRVELISPTSADSPMAGFLSKKGPGLHHICFEVDDLEAEMAKLKTKGMRFLSDTPDQGVGGTRIVFLHPKDAAGVLIELVQKA
jgi:methylmalonyl-CoA/ethylmalonyl-CoA epimerase